MIIINLLQAMLKELQTINHRLQDQSSHQRLWTADDIAEHLKIKKSTVQSTVLKSKGFPEPIILPSGGKRYSPAEVKLWLKRQKGK